jgi:iron complex outermembrane recepter protein
MGQRFTRLDRCTLTALIALLLSAVASAQAQDVIAQQSVQGPGMELEEITVTATRREESVQKVPISIGALGQDEMAELGIKNIADIAAMTPGLQYDVPNGYASTITTLSIRGMNTQVGANVVGIYLDDSPIQSRLPAYGNIGTPLPLTFDMDRVEVERGPQGTLFGAGSEAGTVRFIPNEPGLSTYSGFAQAGLAFTQGGAPSYDIGAAGGGPIVDDKLGFRASVWDQRDGGYIDRVDPLSGQIVDRNANADEKLAGRLALALQATDTVRITPAVYYQQIDQDDSGRFFGNAYGSNASTGIFINGTFLPEVSSDKWVLPSIKVQASLPFADLTFDSSYTHRSLDLKGDGSVFYGGFFSGTGGFGNPAGVSFPTSPLDVTPLHVIGRLQAFTEEVRLASNQPDAFVTWVGGVFFDHRSQREYQSTYTGAFGDPSFDSYYINGLMDDNQLAAFAQADIHVTQKLTATLGERVARVESKERDYNGNGIFNSGEPPVGYSSEQETPNTPRVALTYQIDNARMIYAAVAKGFRVGGGNAPLPDFCGIATPPSYKSDYDWSYEVGTKDKFFDNRLQIDTSVFHVNWFKIQQVVIPPCGSAYATNTGNATFNGFDLDLQGVITDRLRVNLAVGYVNAYFTNDVFIAPGIPLVLTGDKVGQLPQVNPPWNVNLGINYRIALSHNDNVTLHGEYQFDSHNSGPFITQIPTSPDYYNMVGADPSISLFKARAEYERGNADLTLYIDNIFNSHPELGAFQYPVQSNIVTNTTFRPRTLGLEARYKF